MTPEQREAWRRDAALKMWEHIVVRCNHDLSEAEIEAVFYADALLRELERPLANKPETAAKPLREWWVVNEWCFMSKSAAEIYRDQKKAPETKVIHVREVPPPAEPEACEHEWVWGSGNHVQFCKHCQETK